MIICAAIKLTDTEQNKSIVVCGHRHGDCFQMIGNLNERWRKVHCVNQGFITHKGEFLDRKEAYKHAVVCGQINQHTGWYREDNKYEEELYSEDLY